MMKYVKPGRVISPRDFVRDVHVIFDGGIDSFYIAELEWEGGKTFGMRWNVTSCEWEDVRKQNGSIECKGMSTSRSYPIWFILPEIIANHIPKIIDDERQRIEEGKKQLYLFAFGFPG